MQYNTIQYNTIQYNTIQYNMIRFVKFILIVFSIFFTSCTNDLAPKTTDFNFSFTLPQYDVNPRSSTVSTSNQISELQKWIINAQIETSEKVLQNMTQEGTSGQTITIHFENIQVSQNVRIDIELTPKGEEKPSYKGTSEWFITKKGSNKIHITLKKIQYEIIPDDNNDTGTDDKPEIIIDAAVPQIIKQPENVIEIVTENSGEPISIPLSVVTAQSTDNGTLSFVWQEKNVDNIWENSTINSTDDTTKSSIMVDVYKGDSRTFKCIITNTNDSVNGNKIATIETNEATIAYVEGDLTSITATYQSDEYQILGQDFDYTKVTITETYTKDNQQTKVNVVADSSRYTISPSDDSEKAIGYVPYTVTYNEATTIPLTSEIRVPVKYQLKASDFAITSSTSSDYDEINTTDNPKKIAQFTGNTVLTVGSASEASSVPSLIYETENSDSATDYNIMENLQSVWKKTINNQTTDFTDTKADNSIAGTYIYSNTLTVPTDDTWVIGESIQLDYYVQVFPWTLTVNSNDGNSVEDLPNLTGGTTYTLSATNEDLEATTTTDITWESSEQNTFSISDDKLTTPEATTENQTAKITAKVDGTEIGTLNVTVPGIPLGSPANPFTQWSDLKSVMENDSTSTIYISGILGDDGTYTMDATETITIKNAKTIIPTQAITITRGSGFTKAFFENTSSFTLGDSVDTNKITLDGGKKSNIDAQAPLITSIGETAELTLNNCILQNNKNTSDTKGGAINISSGTFTMNGGVVGKEVTENVEPTEKQSWEYAADASNFSNYAKAGGGGIYIASGTATINDAKISYNYVPDPDDNLNQNNSENLTVAHGGGIYIEKGLLTLDKTEVSYNTGYLGGGVKCYSNNAGAGTVTLKETNIKGNASRCYQYSNFGGGVAIKNFTLTIDATDGVATSVIEENYSGDGGALFLECTESTLQNITIQNNEYNANGYQQGTEVLLYDKANMSIGSGDVIIKNEDANDRGVYVRNSSNTLKLSGAAKLDTPIYLENEAMVTVAGELSGDNVASITPAEYGVGTQVLIAENYVTLDVAKFALTPAADGTSYTIDSDGKLVAESSAGGGSSGGTITANVQVSTWSNLKTAIASITDTTTYTEENPYVIEITGNMNTEDSTVEETTVSSHVKLVSNSDCTITRTSAFASVNLFQVNSEASLTIGDANAGGTLTLNGGGTDVSATASLIKVSGTLVLNEKSVLQNNNCKEAYGTSGSAVYSNGGTIKVSGATINNNSNNYSDSYGGAIYIKNGTLNITSGLFENNSTYKNGGAIYVTEGTVNITGGEFTNNIVSSGSYKTENGYGGSAIYIDSATTSISSVEFKNNITYDGVGTLLVTNIGDENTPATINNCTFNNNKAYQKGAAIYTGGASYIEITSCNFTENTVTNTDSTTGTGEQSDVYIGNYSGWTKIDGTEYSEAWSSN